MGNHTLEVALTYASWGWKVLPVVPNGKAPASHHGVKDATDDPDKIKEWWTRNPKMNIGIAAGSDSQIIVFDIDPRNGGDDSWDIWLKENGNPPDGIMALTAGGGQHYIAKYQEGIRSCKLRQGIDLLADGKYFVAYPSIINGNQYEWEASSDPFDGVAPFKIPIKWESSINQKRVSTNESAIGDLIQGDRNNGLTSLAGSMRHLGMKENEILQAIMVVNDTRCSPSLPDSEVRQLVKSVCRYDTEIDVAVDSALGHEAAENLLNNLKEQEDYYLTKATSFLSQPMPIEWAIKKWLPTNSVAMIYGESGIGKSFVAIDMACSVASGKSWQGIKSKQGTVVYLAGEGNYGIRQRVASWCNKHSINSMDNLLVSNKPIDLDGAGGALKVIYAVREMTDEDVSILFVDTLNNHMSGDENSAKDTRAMINNSKIIASALNATVVFVHHTGLNDSSKNRARGSSAWKGSLDSAILISRESDDVIKISCEKMKDSEAPYPIFGEISYVNLGWFDADEEEIKGAVFSLRSDYSSSNDKKESKVSGYMRVFSNAWRESGGEVIDGNPYVSRSFLAEYLQSSGFYPSESTLLQNLKPSKPNGFIFELIKAEVIKLVEFQGKTTGYQVISESFSAQIKLIK